MIIKHNDLTIETLGDPHLGRSFVHGVPLHRRGDREARVWADFRDSLANTEADVHVNMGDLFDKAYVSYDVIMKAAQAYIEAATNNPDCSFVILKGNHDWVRDLDRHSAFDMFAAIVEHMQNIFIVTTRWVFGDELAFFAWHPTILAADMVSKSNHTDATIAFGHWDVESFGGAGENLIPTKQLAAAGFQIAVTGHIHKKDDFERDGIFVQVNGSMQPYAHGEESNDDLYVTLTKAELTGGLHDKCVRVVLEPGEILDEEIDCLSLTIKRLDGADEEMPTVVLGDFDMEKLFRTAFAEVNPEITETLLQQFNMKRLADGS
ncbi:metallophosphoesterase [Mesorhizobium sp. M0016]|uniref:metallophosphoesterase n=1 Tax=Mesorhizobium sp. M0016 TaxID=2956843 RepID=UPI003336CB01